MYRQSVHLWPLSTTWRRVGPQRPSVGDASWYGLSDTNSRPTKLVVIMAHQATHGPDGSMVRDGWSNCSVNEGQTAKALARFTQASLQGPRLHRFCRMERLEDYGTSIRGRASTGPWHTMGGSKRNRDSRPLSMFSRKSQATLTIGAS